MVVHPGGSMRDYEVIETCNEAEPPVAMVFTGQRAFKHWGRFSVFGKNLQGRVADRPYQVGAINVGWAPPTT